MHIHQPPFLLLTHLHHEGATERDALQVLVAEIAVSQIQELVGHCVGLTNGVADKGALAVVGVCIDACACTCVGEGVCWLVCVMRGHVFPGRCKFMVGAVPPDTLRKHLRRVVAA